jgi:DNA-binding GntR family transcriptional regulator
LHGWPDQSIKDHRAVIAALEARDPELARSAMAEHFTVGVAPLTDHLIERGVIGP